MKYANPVTFLISAKPDADFVRVRCYDDRHERLLYSRLHALIRRKKDVEKRCNERRMKFSSDKILWNVLMIGVDSTSRLNSIRRLKNTRRLLINELQAVELQGYGRVGDNTFPNVMSLLTGKFASERPPGPLDETPLLWRPFSRLGGYRTLFSDDWLIDWNIFNLWLDHGNSPGGFIKEPTDYYYRTMNLAQCNDKNSEVTSRRNGNSGAACIGPTFETEFILDWVTRFIGEMNSNRSQDPFFAFSFFSRLTHDDHNDAAFMDLYLTKFFETLVSSNLLRNTVVVLFSDHGIRYGSTRGYTRMGWYEENTPMAFVALPESFRRRHPSMAQSLESNSRSLTTPFDLHETIRRLLTVEAGQRRLSDDA
jgi:hypothetical protein